jgi:PiT family inorganic phosphate transporter
MAIDPLVLVFLSSGLFLGWALGANDAANVFGTAVGTKMVSWRTAAIICSICVLLGAVFSGAGTTETLGKLGAISALPGAFMTALSAGFSVFIMTKGGLPVSTSQAIVGAIIGWNFFSQKPTDTTILLKILSTWILCPLLAGIIAVLIVQLIKFISRRVAIHMITLDAIKRIVGVFIPVQPFPTLELGNFTISSAQQLLLLGGLSIGLGVFTYSRKVMDTVGSQLGSLSATTALIAVISHSIVLFMFASRGLETFLLNLGLPTIPLVPVSSSQAVVGAIIGISILKGVASINWAVLGKILIGWVLAPAVAFIICFIGLFFLQNVFALRVV